MSARDIYSRLESSNPGFPKRDVIRYTKSNSLYTESLEKFSDAQLLGLKMAQVRVLPHSQKRILKNAKRPTKEAGKEVQLVSNFSSYTTQKVTRLIQTLGKILNPHEVYEFPPVVNLGEGSWIKDLQTRRQPGKLVSDMSTKSLSPQQDESRKYNLANTPKFEAAEHISLKSTSAIKQELYGKFASLLVTLWESVKTESPTYKNAEMSFLSSNSGPSGVLLKTHLRRYWEFAPPLY